MDRSCASPPKPGYAEQKTARDRTPPQTEDLTRIPPDHPIERARPGGTPSASQCIEYPPPRPQQSQLSPRSDFAVPSLQLRLQRQASRPAQAFFSDFKPHPQARLPRPVAAQTPIRSCDIPSGHAPQRRRCPSMCLTGPPAGLENRSAVLEKRRIPGRVRPPPTPHHPSPRRQQEPPEGFSLFSPTRIEVGPDRSRPAASPWINRRMARWPCICRARLTHSLHT